MAAGPVYRFADLLGSLYISLLAIVFVKNTCGVPKLTSGAIFNVANTLLILGINMAGKELRVRQIILKLGEFELSRARKIFSFAGMLNTANNICTG